MKKKSIIIAAGGTGGHLFPAISIGEELHNSGYDVHLITDFRGQKYLNNDVKINVHVINIRILKANILTLPQSMTLLVIAFFQSIRMFYKIKPSITIGFGGYPTFAPLVAAAILRVPIIICEQNSFIGKANRIFMKFAGKIALAYKDTINIQSEYKDKVVFTGDITRSSIKNLPQKNNFHSKVFHILIFGGSQGAKIFSTLIPESIKMLMTQHPGASIHIIQQAPKADHETIGQLYKNLGIKYELSEFFHDMHEQYSRAQ